MKLALKPLLSFLVAFVLLIASNLEAKSSPVSLFTSHEYLGHTNQIQNFQDWMTLKPGQENLPLTLNIYNGSHEIPSYKWFRISIGGYIVATEKNLAPGRESAAVDVSGTIQGGNMQILVEAGGVPGSAIWFTLTSPGIELNSVNPQQVRAGQKIVLGGENFSATPNQNTVFVDSKKATVESSTPTSIVAIVPANADIGDNKVQVSVNNLPSRSLSLSVFQRPAPELLAFDVWMAPPGGTVSITGRNFSANLSDNKVYFGNVQTEVTYATETQLIVVVPNWSWGGSQLNIPVSVVTDGVRSANTLPIDIGPMYHGATPQFQQN